MLAVSETPLSSSEKAYDPNAFGIITTSPGLVIGGLEDADVVPTSVVLSGRTPVKVSSENGAIQAGDLLTPSTIPGVAMRATKAGQIIGQAMGPFDGEGIGTTMAFVKTNFAHGSAPAEQDAKSTLAYLLNEQADFTDVIDLSNIVTDRVVAGIEVITPKLTADKISTNSIESANGKDIQLGDYPLTSWNR